MNNIGKKVIYIYKLKLRSNAHFVNMDMLIQSNRFLVGIVESFVNYSYTYIFFTTCRLTVSSAW